MKKIMIALAAVAMAMGVQAAAVSWKVTNADYKNASVYAITGLSSAEVVALFSSGTESDWAEGLNGATSAGTLNSRGVKSSYTDNVGSTIVFALVDTSIAEGNKWAVSEDMSTAGLTYEGTATPPGTLELTAENFASTGTFTASSIPEPTSGLLMLLGMAGLALRRKQK